VPQRKRLDLALDVFESVREHDPRFSLSVIGRPPSDFDWVTRREEEVEFFRHAYARIQDSSLLRGAVAFHPFTSDLATFLSRTGFVLSTSDSEGHQVALAEAAASGAVPLILERPGVSDQYPDRWVHASPLDAAEAALSVASNGFAEEQHAASEHAAAWSTERILPQWIDALWPSDSTRGQGIT
jgi:glycosyltransferase involved in cell wall biosynthesis